MELVIREYTDFDLEEVRKLYLSVGWTNYTDRPHPDEFLTEAFKHSLLTLGAFDKDKLVGFIRVVGDGVSVVFVQDLVVMPQYQRRGIGTKLMQSIMDHYSHVYQFDLMTDHTPKTRAFYTSLGLTDASEIGCTAFFSMR